MNRWACVWMLAAMIPLAAGAQSSASNGTQAGQQAIQAPAPSGIVTGTVLAEDTQQPARFVQVILQRVPEPQPQTQSGNVRGGVFGFAGGGGSARTDVDGTFQFDNVAPGDYYVLAAAPGYIAERYLLQAEFDAGAKPEDLLARLPTVHVTADSNSSIRVSLHRGSTLGGVILWEDGSPASGVQVSAVLATQPPALPQELQQISALGSFGNGGVTTDDRGVFRISGLADGEYVLEATLQTRGGFFGRGPVRFASPVHVYVPGVFRRTDAKTVKVHRADERTDLRMVIDLRGLHSVSGTVSSTNSAETVASGQVMLSDSVDRTLRIYGSIESDGTYMLHYVPPGSYTLTVAGASTRVSYLPGRARDRDSANDPATTYQPFSESLTVADNDLTGVNVTLSPVTKPAQ